MNPTDRVDAATNRLLPTLGTYDSRGNLVSASGQSYSYDSLSRQTKAGGERYLYDGAGERVALVTGGQHLYTVTPCRLKDTREPAPGTPLNPQAPLIVQATGACGIPVGAASLVGNLTAVDPPDYGKLTLSAGDESPATSTLNYRPGVVRANNFVVGLSSTGQLRLTSEHSLHAVIDVSGYFMSPPNLESWKLTYRDEGNRISTEYLGTSRQKDYFYLGNLLVATRTGGGSGTYLYYASDHLGTPRLVTNASKAKVEEHSYDAFGIELAGGFGSQPLKFAAMERDSSSGNDYVHARYQSASLGRFLGPDLLGGKPEEPQTWNRYAYAQNNPLRYVDPDGHVVWEAADWASYYQSSREWVGAFNAFVAHPSVETGAMAAVRFATAAGDAAAVLLPGVPAVGGTISRVTGEAPRLLSLTKRNFRENVQRFLGAAADKTVEAHHRLPRAFEQQFSRAGLNIHDPRHGALLEKHLHRSSARAYNQRWDEFFRSGPKTKADILKFLQKIEAEFATNAK